MKRLALALLLVVCPAWAGITLNPDVTPDTIAQTICVPGWAATVRPPVAYTNKVKRDLMDKAGVEWSHAAEIELDHLVNLSVGGNPTSPDNLRLQTWAKASPWPQIDFDAHGKDAVEVRLKNMVCRGQIPLAEAQQCIYADWQACALAHPSTHAKEAK